MLLWHFGFQKLRPEKPDFRPILFAVLVDNE
jgi:hypothetical protein